MRNYEILSGDNLVAVWENNSLKVKNKKLLPLYLKKISNADMWLETRAIDGYRPNSRLLKKALGLPEKDDLAAVLYVNGATITDNYWVREIGSCLKYNDIKYTDDYFSTLALKGTYNSFNRAAKSKRTKTPELTNIGSFEKCWKLINGKWWMYKKANHQEMFSEIFIYELGLKLNMNMAVYKRGNGFIKSLDFTNGASVNFEPASAFMGDDEDYINVVKALKNICVKAIPDYVKMIFLDTICVNPDRHTNNFGLLRDIVTGDLIGLAPNFDNNMALISKSYPSKAKKTDVLVNCFNTLLCEYPEFKDFVPKVTEEILKEILEKINMKVKSQQIIDIIMSRYDMVLKN